MTQPKKWYPPTASQEWQRIQKAEDQAILEAYIKAEDPAAIAYKAELDKQEDPRPE